MQKEIVKENAKRLVMELGKQDEIILGYNCFQTALDETINIDIRIATLETALAEYEDQNYHDIAYAIYQLIKVTR